MPEFKFTTASKQKQKISKSNPPCFPPGNILICMNGPDLDRARLTSIRRFVSTYGEGVTRFAFRPRTNEQKSDPGVAFHQFHRDYGLLDAAYELQVANLRAPIILSSTFSLPLFSTPLSPPSFLFSSHRSKLFKSL